MVFFYLALLVLGLAVGSFLGMLSFRLPRNLSLKGRSFCDACSKKISWYDNIPVLSYFLLRARCRLCGTKISFRYPVVEALTAAVFLVTGWLATGRVPAGTLPLPFLLFMAAAFLTLIITDLEFEVLPDEVLLPLGAAVFLVLLTLSSPALFQHLLTGFSVFIFFLLLFILTAGRGMGFGDVKMSFILGSLLGWPASLVWLFLAFLTGAVSGVILILAGKARFGRPIAFGPYLLISAYAALFYGEKIWEIWGI